VRAAAASAAAFWASCAESGERAAVAAAKIRSNFFISF
jgi:hypothetical protein